MELTSITLWGGEVNNLTATPGSFAGCDLCMSCSDLKEWVTSSGVVYQYCTTCWVDISESAEELEVIAQECRDAWFNGPGRLDTCEEPEQKCPALECDACGQNPATEEFWHLDSRTFKLCRPCFTDVDQEDDYGMEFGSVPRPRRTVPSVFCECPLPCDFTSPTQCDLCHGSVAVHTPIQFV